MWCGAVFDILCYAMDRVVYLFRDLGVFFGGKEGVDVSLDASYIANGSGP